MQFKARTLKLSKLLLDPNNYRFLDNGKYKRKISTKFHVSSVQEATLNLLENTHSYQLSELKASILENGFVPVERIVVKEYAHATDEKYLVVEGNRRVAALLALLREDKEGVIHLSAEQKKNFSSIPCVVLVSDHMQAAERTIMGIRHIAGTKEWGAYQQAQLIHELIDEEGLSSDTVAERLGMTKVETNRRYRAMKALKEMERDEEYGESAHKDYYRLFHELVSLPKVREKFGWNHEETTFADVFAARQFFELVAPQQDGSHSKIMTYGDVRKLKSIVDSPKAFELLLDPDCDFREALAEAEYDQKRRRNEDPSIIHEFREFLESISVPQLQGLTVLNVEELERIGNLIQETVDAHAKLST